jgi:Bacterial Ig-like domain (group 1)
MLNRNAPIAVCLCASALAAFGQQGTRYVVEFSGAQLQAFSADSNSATPVFNANLDPNPPTGVSQMIAKPDGSKFYIMSSTGIQSITPAFAANSFNSISGISGTPTAMAMSPDGKYLYVGATGLYIINTSNDTIIPNTVPIGSAYIVGIVFSADSQYAYVLTSEALGSSISQVSTAGQTIMGQPLSLPNGCTSSATPVNVSGQTVAAGNPLCFITVSPDQLIYVSNGYYIYEVNPATLALTSTTSGIISTNTSTIGPLRFTPDGSTAYAVDLTPSVTGRSLLQVTLATHAFSELNYLNSGMVVPTFVDVLPVSATRVFAYTSSDPTQLNPTTLFDVTPTPFSAAPSTSLSGVPTTVISNTVGAVISNEQTGAQNLYILQANGNQTDFNKINLTTNSVVVSGLAALGAGPLEFVAVPPQTGAAQFIQFNNNQTLAAGATSAPLAAALATSAGIPVYNVPVTYSAGSTGIVVNNPTPTTNGAGFVQSTVTIPSTLASGSYSIAVSGAGVSATFTVVVQGSGNPTTPSGASQVTIVGGQGMLLYSLSGSYQCEDIYPFASNVPGISNGSQCPLTILVTDTHGNPLANEPVTFSVTQGTGGALGAAGTVTDSNGLASAIFLPLSTFNCVANFEGTQVTASTAVGTATFYETTIDQSMPNACPSPYQALFALLTPMAPYTITAGEGDTIPNAIQYQITSPNVLQAGAPIPNVSIRLSSALDPDMTSPNAVATPPGTLNTCQGNNLSNSNGIVSCNIQVACQLGPATLGVVIGEASFDTRISLNVGPGTSRTLNLVSGNNQSGHSGQTLGTTLVATITDKCGTAVSGVPVTWQVTGGSATLTNTVSVSNINGDVSTGVVLGQTPGPVVVTVSLSGGATLTFNATNNATVGSLTLTSGGGQTTMENQAFAQPLVFTAKDTNGNPVSGVQVNFAIVSGSATLSATSATTTTAGQASVSVTAGASPGTVTVQATYATFTASASLTVQAPGPVLSSTSFTNTASGKQGLVPCGFATATGSGLLSSANEFVPGNPLGLLTLPLPYTVAGISISVSTAGNTVPAPIDFVSSVNGVQTLVFQTPCETVPGTATVAVTINAGTSNAVTTPVPNVPVYAAQPGVFTYAGPNGATYAYLIDTNNNAISPSNLARPGGTYFLVATNLGQTTPRAVTDSSGNGSQTIPISQVIVGIDNEGVPVLAVQYVAIGVYYVEFQLPATACASNNQPQPCSPTGTNLPLTLGEIVNGQTVYDGEYSYLAGVQ